MCIDCPIPNTPTLVWARTPLGRLNAELLAGGPDCQLVEFDERGFPIRTVEDGEAFDRMVWHYGPDGTFDRVDIDRALNCPRRPRPLGTVASPVSAPGPEACRLPPDGVVDESIRAEAPSVSAVSEPRGKGPDDSHVWRHEGGSLARPARIFHSKRDRPDQPDERVDIGYGDHGYVTRMEYWSLMEPLEPLRSVTTRWDRDPRGRLLEVRVERTVVGGEGFGRHAMSSAWHDERGEMDPSSTDYRCLLGVWDRLVLAADSAITR